MGRVEVLNVGRFAPPPASADKFFTPKDIAEKDALLPGDLVHWHGVRFEWTSRHAHASKLESWRASGDNLADAALDAAHYYKREMGGTPKKTKNEKECPFSQDNLSWVQEAARKHDGAAGAFLAEVSEVPEFVDWARIARGQQFFLRNLAGAGSALLFVSLVGGFGAPRINKVLSSTGYLTSPSKHTYRRLVETIQMVSDCMDPGSLHPGGSGWAAVLRVRLLHSAVRTRLMGQSDWDKDAWGVPINQEDLLVTQLAFSQLVLVSLERMRVPMSMQDMEDYLHLWRLIGHYMGVDSVLGAQVFDFESTEAMLESVMLHLVEPDDTSAFISFNVLESVARYSPTKYTVEHMASMTRRMVGETYADALGVPPGEGTWSGWIRVQTRIFNIQMASFLAHLPVVGTYVTAFMHWGLKKVILKTQDGKRTQYLLKRSPSGQLRTLLELEASSPRSSASASPTCGSNPRSSFFARI
mmetsp:Transcript_28609/g.54710  ORF Transcript_28609/g.54710 Transcript_28609/m.54710 type:complete len:470 (+) Transcript_28609:248-1657(+)|eukprot:CAMPEP_0114241806 /NCGR_PEP_ID=MMETSP0058-20121206/9828_1 /TAXON_ID=36894 /ORGANISM="Pyramimonas parkeae, CCMP726" /LENGTH=469 /DNA_ID=CAMNT_0001354355 /DNA_START=169 /DNA_END=1578 /DNA_ORIENTATION=-